MTAPSLAAINDGRATWPDLAHVDPYPPKTVYLAGPISGLSYADARQGWREAFAAMLPPHIFAVSPMRGKDFLKGRRKIKGVSGAYDMHPLATDRGIVTRDENDVRQCDAMVVNFLGADSVSIGTCCEIGMARILRKPVVLIMEPKNVHNHPFITEFSGYQADTLEDAAHIIGLLLTPGV